MPGRAARPNIFAILCLMVAGLVGGCGATPPVLSVASRSTGQHFKERFTEAYTARDAAGDYKVVLVRDPVDEVTPGSAGAALNEAKVPPVRQVLEVRLLWRPMQGAKFDSPASTNAALHWYVLTHPTSAGTCMIHYAGTAFVTIVPDGPGAEVSITDGSLQFSERRGQIVDPLKSFSIEGKFDAEANSAKLDQIEGDVKAAIAEARGDGGEPGATSKPAGGEASVGSP